MKHFSPSNGNVQCGIFGDLFETRQTRPWWTHTPFLQMKRLKIFGQRREKEPSNSWTSSEEPRHHHFTECDHWTTTKWWEMEKCHKCENQMCVWIAQNEINEIKTLISEAPVVRETDPIFAQKMSNGPFLDLVCWFPISDSSDLRFWNPCKVGCSFVERVSTLHNTTQHNESYRIIKTMGGTLEKGSRKGRETAQRSWNSLQFSDTLFDPKPISQDSQSEYRFFSRSSIENNQENRSITMIPTNILSSRNGEHEKHPKNTQTPWFSLLSSFSHSCQNHGISRRNGVIARNRRDMSFECADITFSISMEREFSFRTDCFVPSLFWSHKSTFWIWLQSRLPIFPCFLNRLSSSTKTLLLSTQQLSSLLTERERENEIIFSLLLSLSLSLSYSSVCNNTHIANSEGFGPFLPNDPKWYWSGFNSLCFPLFSSSSFAGETFISLLLAFLSRQSLVMAKGWIHSHDRRDGRENSPHLDCCWLSRRFQRKNKKMENIPEKNIRSIDCS